MAFLRRTIEYSLHLEADEFTFHKSKEFRSEMTEAEKMLWNELKNRKLGGLKFRRQHPLHFYIADFYCHEKRLAIEVDGEIHRKKEVRSHDENRSAELDRLGVTIVRFTNKDVLNNMKKVLDKILHIAGKTDSPSPPGEGVGG
jgi:cyclase